MKVVCIGAHPDDVEMGMGGSIVNHVKKGDQVSIILCTLGGVSGDPKSREKEAFRAAKILGVDDLRIMNYSVFNLNKPEREFARILRAEFNEITPDRVYTHSSSDVHQVHIGVNNSVVSAARSINQILFYETISSTTPEFLPNAYIDITKEIGKKIKSLQAHKSQSHRFYIQPNVIKSLANARYVWGKVGTNPKGYAEAFHIHKFIRN